MQPLCGCQRTTFHDFETLTDQRPGEVLVNGALPEVTGPQESSVQMENPRNVVGIGFGEPAVINSTTAYGLDETGKQRSNVDISNIGDGRGGRASIVQARNPLPRSRLGRCVPVGRWVWRSDQGAPGSVGWWRRWWFRLSGARAPPGARACTGVDVCAASTLTLGTGPWRVTGVRCLDCMKECGDHHQTAHRPRQPEAKQCGSHPGWRVDSNGHPCNESSPHKGTLRNYR